MDEITTEQWMAFASKYVLKAASLDIEVERLQEDLRIKDDLVEILRLDAKKKEDNDA